MSNIQFEDKQEGDRITIKVLVDGADIGIVYWCEGWVFHDQEFDTYSDPYKRLHELQTHLGQVL